MNDDNEGQSAVAGEEIQGPPLAPPEAAEDHSEPEAPFVVPALSEAVKSTHPVARVVEGVQQGYHDEEDEDES